MQFEDVAALFGGEKKDTLSLDELVKLYAALEPLPKNPKLAAENLSGAYYTRCVDLRTGEQGLNSGASAYVHPNKIPANITPDQYLLLCRALRGIEARSLAPSTMTGYPVPQLAKYCEEIPERLKRWNAEAESVDFQIVSILPVLGLHDLQGYVRNFHIDLCNGEAVERYRIVHAAFAGPAWLVAYKYKGGEKVRGYVLVDDDSTVIGSPWCHLANPGNPLHVGSKSHTFFSKADATKLVVWLSGPAALQHKKSDVGKLEIGIASPGYVSEVDPLWAALFKLAPPIWTKHSNETKAYTTGYTQKLAVVQERIKNQLAAVPDEPVYMVMMHGSSQLLIPVKKTRSRTLYERKRAVLVDWRALAVEPGASAKTIVMVKGWRPPANGYYEMVTGTPVKALHEYALRWVETKADAKKAARAAKVVAQAKAAEAEVLKEATL